MITEKTGSAKTYNQLSPEEESKLIRQEGNFDDALLGFIVGACVVGIIALL